MSTAFRKRFIWFPAICFLTLLLHEGRSYKVSTNGCSEEAEGNIVCTLISPYYDHWQYGTCLSDNGVRDRSRGKRKCADWGSVLPVRGYYDMLVGRSKHGVNKTAAEEFCFYPCMGKNPTNPGYGHVAAECLCKPPEPDHSLTMASDCLNPTGYDCTWYSRCLEAHHPCEHTNSAYAVSYAQHYCTSFGEKAYLFSKAGQAWIDRARKCLQVALVPYLHTTPSWYFLSGINQTLKSKILQVHPEKSNGSSVKMWHEDQPTGAVTCAELKQAAIDTHAPCYVDSGVCDLPVKDLWEIFKVIQDGLWSIIAWTLTDGDVFKSMEVLFESLKVCLVSGNRSMIHAAHVHLTPSSMVSPVQDFFPHVETSRSDFKRSVNVICKDCFTRDVAEAIANNLNWSELGLDWLSFYVADSEKTSHSSETISMVLIVDERNRKNVSQHNRPAIEDANILLKSGDLVVKVGGWEVAAILECADVMCNSLVHAD